MVRPFLKSTTKMKTKLVNIQVAVPDNGRPHSITAFVADTTPASSGDHDRVRHLERQLFVVPANPEVVSAL